MNIGIVGYGDLGQAIEANFEESCIVGVYDENCSAQDGPQFSSSIVELAKGSNFIFITSPVSTDDTGEYDSSKIDDAMREILVEASTGGLSPTVIISNSVPPSVISKYLIIYQDARFVVCPAPIRKLDHLYDNQSDVNLFVGGSSVTACSVCKLYEQYASMAYGEKKMMTHLDACVLKERYDVS